MYITGERRTEPIQEPTAGKVVITMPAASSMVQAAGELPMWRPDMVRLVRAAPTILTMRTVPAY